MPKCREMTMSESVDVPRAPQARREPNLGRLEVELMWERCFPCTVSYQQLSNNLPEFNLFLFSYSCFEPAWEWARRAPEVVIFRVQCVWSAVCSVLRKFVADEAPDAPLLHVYMRRRLQGTRKFPPSSVWLKLYKITNCLHVLYNCTAEKERKANSDRKICI